MSLLERQVFTYANVPYRIKPYSDMLADPHSTIVFDATAHEQAMALAAAMGADGLAVTGPQGLVRANLTDKLLVVALSKLTNYIPEAGIWMNTQRPEWNDANNALVGYGVSMVTLYYLRRYLAFCQELFSESASGTLEIASEISDLLQAVTGVLEAHASRNGDGFSNRERKRVLDQLGQAGTAYRAKVYVEGFSGARVGLPVARLRAFCEVALRHIDGAIRVNRRADGLYHAYHTMKLVGDGIDILTLHEMLEGQVAILSSGALSAEESVSVLDALRASALYRADQASYLLYPDHPLPHFLEKNNLPAGAVAASPLLSALLAAGDESLVTRDVEGGFHFNPAFGNVGHLRQVLRELQGGPYRTLVLEEETSLLDLYEQVFDHQSFTGRSGTFYKYEGLGCIYWHMVSKLLLAVDEVQQRAKGGNPATLARLKQHYQAIRDGLGVHKPPALHGAIPTDPYSHTTGFAGAQQPGMTGQVKEDWLTRLSEMGVHVQGGRITFQPWRVPLREFLGDASTFQFIDVDGEARSLSLEAGTYAFTFCQVPVVGHRTGTPGIRITRRDTTDTLDDLSLDLATSQAIFNRTGGVQRLDVFLGV